MWELQCKYGLALEQFERTDALRAQTLWEHRRFGSTGVWEHKRFESTDASGAQTFLEHRRAESKTSVFATDGIWLTFSVALNVLL